jgi:hypothetical protein
VTLPTDSLDRYQILIFRFDHCRSDVSLLLSIDVPSSSLGDSRAGRAIQIFRSILLLRPSSSSRAKQDTKGE